MAQNTENTARNGCATQIIKNLRTTEHTHSCLLAPTYSDCLRLWRIAPAPCVTIGKKYAHPSPSQVLGGPACSQCSACIQPTRAHDHGFGYRGRQHRARRLAGRAHDRLRPPSQAVVDADSGRHGQAIDRWHKEEPNGRTLIHAGRLWNGTGAEVRTNVDILVVNNRIRSIEPHNETAHREAQTRVVDASALSVLPGLWESVIGQSAADLRDLLALEADVANLLSGVAHREDPGRMATAGGAFAAALAMMNGAMKEGAAPGGVVVVCRAFRSSHIVKNICS